MDLLNLFFYYIDKHGNLTRQFVKLLFYLHTTFKKIKT